MALVPSMTIVFRNLMGQFLAKVSKPLGLVLGLMWLSQTAVLASGYLTLETNPTGAEIWFAISGGSERRYLGDSPILNREMVPGTYDFWIIVENRDTLTMPSVNLVEGQHTQISRELPLHYAFISIHTDPDSGSIRMDEVELGEAPYSNAMVHPNTYRLHLKPHASRFRPRIENVRLQKGDSLNLMRPFSYRDKTFGRENLSILPGRIQVETGIQYRNRYGFIDTLGKRHNYGNESEKDQIDFPLTIRVGFPFGIEPHIVIPFKRFQKFSGGAPFPADLAMGLKFTLRQFNAGVDVTYAIGQKADQGGLNHDVLTLQGLGMLDKDKLLFQGNAGFEFHMKDRDDPKLNPGNQVFIHAQAGYVADMVQPYVGGSLRFKLNGDKDGKDLDNSGFLIALEPGLTLDVQDWVSFQLGIPFSAMGTSAAKEIAPDSRSNAPLYWGLHFSAAFRFPFMDG
jgi:hypothetical protein